MIGLIEFYIEFYDSDSIVNTGVYLYPIEVYNAINEHTKSAQEANNASEFCSIAKQRGEKFERESYMIQVV